MLILIDNYDSFSYNLYQLIGSIEPDITVIRNDAKTAAEIEAMQPDGIILSPGPGRPEDAGICVDVVKQLGDKIPILGVCLGHQAICVAYGGVVGYASRLMHGKQSDAKLDVSCAIFKGCEPTEKVARYHSLAAEEKSLPDCLHIVAKATDGDIMAVAHESHPVYGLQFHPESIMTPAGPKILENFIQITKEKGF